ncbi:hypothetical protein EYW49_20075 [Siculibacillus lacustris]|uniref:Ead/Ea22-like family protein n=1 Tax=Siculibacillus lacustris TaxID=1549641 RepID=A0A4Q9VHC8_9HYPH|nr:ead/Ea22-like family protein [Siculibacillus lacustris]TBW33581.1 hypothetical protein EYW49_20075 [Siculibacillus lacustris]
MAEIDLDKLEAVAKAATPCEWRRLGFSVRSSYFDGEHEVARIDCQWGPNADGANVEHISTFDPPTVLALISRLRKAEADAAELRATLSRADADHAADVQALRDQRDEARAALAAARNDALEEASEAANGIDPKILEGRTQGFVSIYCASRVSAADAIRALKELMP